MSKPLNPILECQISVAVGFLVNIYLICSQHWQQVQALNLGAESASTRKLHRTDGQPPFFFKRKELLRREGESPLPAVSFYWSHGAQFSRLVLHVVACYKLFSK